MKYILMHREKEFAEIKLDEFSNMTCIYKIYSQKHFHVGTVGKQRVDKRALANWWSKRSIDIAVKAVYSKPSATYKDNFTGYNKLELCIRNKYSVSTKYISNYLY